MTDKAPDTGTMACTECGVTLTYAVKYDFVWADGEPYVGVEVTDIWGCPHVDGPHDDGDGDGEPLPLELAA